MPKIKEVTDSLESLPGVVKAFASPVIDWITVIELSNRKKNVDVTLRLPLDFLKKPDCVKELAGCPLLVVLNLEEDKPKRAKVKDGWEFAGRECTILGPSSKVNGMDWTPIVFDDEEDPTWHKTTALEKV